jgi:acetyl esterase/lipase
VAEHATAFGGDPTQLFVTGDSAGATMVVVTVMRLRDEGGLRVKARLLIYPVTDYPDAALPSYTERTPGADWPLILIRRMPRCHDPALLVTLGQKMANNQREPDDTRP